MALGDTELLFRIRADSKDAQDELKKFRKTFDDETKSVLTMKDRFLSLGQGVGLSTEQMTALAKVAPIAGAGIAAVAGVGIAAGATLFTLAKNASDAGSKIHDLSEQTGLSAETLSSLDYAAGQSGSSVEALSSEIAKFTKLIGEANNGSQEAKEKLQSLGIDTQKPITDLNAALSTAFRTIYNAKPGIEQGTLAMAAFGKAGENAIPVIDSFKGNLEQLMATAKRLGAQLSKEDVDAADEFGDALNLLEVQVKATSNKIALQYAPDITKAMKEVSEALAESKDVIVGIGKVIGFALEQQIQQLKGARVAWALFRAGLAESPSQALALALAGGGAAPPPAPEPVVTGEAGQTTRVVDYGNAVQTTPQGDRIRTPEQLKAERKKAEDDLEKANQLIRGSVATAADVAYQRAIAQANALLERTGDYISYVAKAKVAEGERWEAREKQFAAERSDIARSDDAEGVKAARLKVNLSQEEMARAEYNLRVEELNRELGDKALASLQETHRRKRELEEAESDWYINHQRQLAERGAISFEEARERIEKEMRDRFAARTTELQEEQAAAVGNAEAYDQITHALEMLRDEYSRFNRDVKEDIFKARGQDADAYIAKLREIIRLTEEMDKESPTKPVDVPGVGNFGKPAPTWGPGSGPYVDPSTLGDLGTPPPPNLSPWHEAFGNLKSIAGGTFTSMTQGFAQMVGAFAAGARGSGQSFGQIARAAISSFTSMAVVQALMELAYGFAALTPWGAAIYGPAAFHFKSAALLGAAAVAGLGIGALVGGGGGGESAVAGQTFGGSGSSTNTERDRTIREARTGGAPDPNQPQVLGHMIVDVKHDDGHTERQMVKVWRGMGRFRDEVLYGTIGQEMST
jgi:hypothetical protein